MCMCDVEVGLRLLHLKHTRNFEIEDTRAEIDVYI